jgi:putative flippase GtrA
MHRLGRELVRLVRSGGVGLVATAMDLTVLGVLTHGLGVHPRTASWPALLVGGLVNFGGNRRFVFRAKNPHDLPRQAVLFTFVELLSLGLNGALFEGLMRAMPSWSTHALVLRLLTTNLVFLCVSYPLWRRVFVPSPATPRYG